MSSWLDTETKELLQHVPPERLAPPEPKSFALVALNTGADRPRLVRAVQRIRRCTQHEAERILDLPLPRTVATGLSYEDASIGQFELVCCDCVSVLLHDEIAQGGDPDYLRQLYAQVRQSSEFEEVGVEIRSVPSTPEGERFLEQFLGRSGAHRPAFPLRERMMRKKARIMLHWARKTGADVAMADG